MKEILLEDKTKGIKNFINIMKKDEPSIIFLEDFKSFEQLWNYRDLIKELKLVPIKSDEIHTKYHSISKEDLIASINFENENVIFRENKYPYLLPDDISQNIIWIKEGVSEEIVEKFIEEKLTKYGKAIVFERGISDIKMVKGSFPFLRHWHFWHKK